VQSQTPEYYNLNKAVKTFNKKRRCNRLWNSFRDLRKGSDYCCGGTDDYRRDNVAGESQAGNATSRAETALLHVPDRGECKTTPLPPCFISVILYKTSRRLLRSRDEAIKVMIDALTQPRSVKHC
jgi:hypothetical protein